MNENWVPAEQALSAGCQQLGLNLTSLQQDKLMQYIQMLLHWNKAYNLTAVTNPVQVVRRHLLDSLSVLPSLPIGALLDAGTGAGLPGIPLAVARAEQQFYLLDSNGKRVQFLRHVCHQLQLDNVQVIQARLETCSPASFVAPPKHVITRAFAPLDRQLLWLAEWLESGSTLFAMVAELTEQQLMDLPSEYTLHDKISLHVPGEDAIRQLLIISSASNN